MRVWFGMPVVLDDEAWGEISGLIIDPVARRLAHVVVEPAGQHEQARLVSMEHIAPAAESRLRLLIGPQELRRLPLVRDSTYQRPSRPVLPGRTWDVGVRYTPGAPRYPIRDVPRAEYDDERTIEVVFDRIPKATIELRAESGFQLAGGNEVGRVAGVILDSAGTLLRLGVLRLPRLLRQVVIVPAERISRFETDRVVSSLGPDEYSALPREPIRPGRR